MSRHLGNTDSRRAADPGLESRKSGAGYVHCGGKQGMKWWKPLIRTPTCYMRVSGSRPRLHYTSNPPFSLCALKASNDDGSKVCGTLTLHGRPRWNSRLLDPTWPNFSSYGDLGVKPPSPRRRISFGRSLTLSFLLLCLSNKLFFFLVGAQAAPGRSSPEEEVEGISEHE